LRNPGPNHPDTARIEVRLGGTLAKLGRFQEATALAEQGLRTAEEALGPENDQLGLILNYLGIVYAEQGRYSDAESAFRRAIRISARLGDAHPEHLVGLQNYAALLRLMHRNKEAGRIEAQLRRALALTEGADFRKAA
jgi:tetratricopeptide (TPR) repeat protein